jgi:hypothetical protein
MGLLKGQHIRAGGADGIKLALEIKRARPGPGPVHDVEIFRRPAVTFRFFHWVAVHHVFHVRDPGDDVHGQAAVPKLIKGGELPRHQGRGHETGPVRDQIVEPFRVSRGKGGHRNALGRLRGVAHQN